MKLTLPQQDVYFEQLLYPESPIYNIGAKTKIKGELHIEVLKKAYMVLLNQHDAYRIALTNHKGDIEINFLNNHHAELEFVDFSNHKNPEEQARLYIQKAFLKPFDILSGNILHRSALVKLSHNFHWLFSVDHHIITDGWGTSLMFQRLVKNYNELLQYGTVKTQYPFSYKDFTEDDAVYQKSDQFLKGKNYWVQKFQSLPENIFNKTENTVHVYKSKRKTLILKRALYNRLTQLAVTYKASPFHVILAVLYTYFGRKHQNNDFSIGLPVLNRSTARYKKTVGLFMGVSPLRMQLNFDATFKELIQDIKQQLRQDYRHQRFPLGKLIQELRIFEEKEKLFNITLSYEKQDYAHNFMNTQTRVVPLTHESERVALAIYIREFDASEDVKIDFDYNLGYFNESAITQVVCHFENLIEKILTAPGEKLKALTYLTPEEERQLLITFNNTATVYPKDKTLLDIFREQVKKIPRKTAVRDDNASYTYAELNVLSDKIAAYLINTCGKEDNFPVAVSLDRSARLIAVLLGILKSGKAYIPLDPDFPQDRLHHIIQNSRAKLLICKKNHPLQDTKDIIVVSLENILENIEDITSIPSKTISPEDTAYIIYTSGSTGKPKGVEIGHKSLLNFLVSMQQKPGIDAQDVLFSVTTYAFDISILEFFTPLLSGATLYMANRHTLSDPGLIIQKLDEIRPAIIQGTPSFYQMLFNAGWKGDKTLKILCGGDALSESLADKLVKNSLEVWNMYGPTETTIWSGIKRIKHPEDASNIGKPIHNTQFYILDEFLSPLPTGVIGDIYIGGDGLAKGYHNNETLTREKFIKNPFRPKGLIYKTGDVGKWNEDGEIIFSGRNDNQVKIRGYRIELGEIESTLNRVQNIKEAVVIARKGDREETFLAAYIKIDGKLDKEAILDALKTELPEYMIPYVIIPLEEFPLTPNKKINRKALMQMPLLRDAGNKRFKAPESDLEIKLSGLWKEVLYLDTPVSVDDNFFALGGHSLNAVKLIGLINEKLLLHITLKTIFDYPTIVSLSRYLEQLTPGKSVHITPSETKDFYHLTPSQYNIWLASRQKNHSIAYNMPAAYRVEGILHIAHFTRAIRKIIKKYEILRTNFIEINGIPYQKISPFKAINFNISTVKLPDDELEDAISEFINEAFDLESGVLLRIKLFQLNAKNAVLTFCTHHTIMDGGSLEVFIKECIKNYNAISTGMLAEDTLELQFRDYSEWLNESVERKAPENELFWKNYLRNYRFKETFRSDFEIEKGDQKGNDHYFEFSKETTSGLKELAAKEKTTLYNVLAAALNGFIYKFSRHNDICIGSVNSGRTLPALDKQIGMFVKTLILRTQIGPEDTFIDLLKNVQGTLLELENYQDIPFDKLASTFFDVILAYQNPEFSFENIDELTHLKLHTHPVHTKYSRLPLLFNFFESDHQLKGIITYNSGMYEAETIQIISLKLMKLLSVVILNPSIKIDEIDILLTIEKNKKVDFDFNF